MENNPQRDLSPAQIGNAIRAIRAETCPACGVAKPSRETFCAGCTERLPLDVRVRLTDRDHYLATFSEAVAHLDSE